VEATKVAECAEEIARGGNCGGCGARWVTGGTGHRFLQHRDDCPYWAATEDEDVEDVD
jgi:hypothetical protein